MQLAGHARITTGLRCRRRQRCRLVRIDVATARSPLTGALNVLPVVSGTLHRIWVAPSRCNHALWPEDQRKSGPDPPADAEVSCSSGTPRRLNCHHKVLQIQWMSPSLMATAGLLRVTRAFLTAMLRDPPAAPASATTHEKQARLGGRPVHQSYQKCGRP